MNNTLIKVDGSEFEKLATISDDTLNQLISKRLLKKTDDNRFKISFVGYIEINGTVLISVPYGVSTNQLANNRVEIQHLIKKVIKVIQFFSQHYSGANEFCISGKIAASFKILEDFENYGLITRNKRTNSLRGTGAIDWTKTIRKNTPAKSGKNWIYESLVRRNKKIHESHELTALHRWALCKSLGHIQIVSDEFEHMNDLFTNILSNEEASGIASRQIGIATRDRDLLFLDLVQKLLSNDATETISAIYTSSFNIIWEKALQFVFKHEKKLKKKLPNVIWADDDTSMQQLHIKPRSSSGSPEVDIAFMNNNELYILDAKYYDLFNTGYRPGLTDLWKQFYYEQAYKIATSSNSTPKGGLIFPYFDTGKKLTIKKFSTVQFHVESANSDKVEMANIPAFVASIDDVLEQFLTGISSQKDYIRNMYN